MSPFFQSGLYPYTKQMTCSDASAANLLDPLVEHKVQVAAIVLAKHFSAASNEVRFKLVDVAGPPKTQILEFLRIKGPKCNQIDRKARIYYHARSSHLLGKALVNITTSTVEESAELPGVQRPIDGVEFDQVHNVCNTHPTVIAEIEKLKLPAGAKVLNESWAYGTDDANERRRLFQCYMYIVLNEDPEANHYSLPVLFAPIFDAHTLELVRFERLPQGVESEVLEATAPWHSVQPVGYRVACLARMLSEKI